MDDNKALADSVERIISEMRDMNRGNTVDEWADRLAALTSPQADKARGEDSLSVVAVVKVNNEEGLVLNRPLRLLYEQDGKDYVGKDGPFRRLLAYSPGSGRFVAFAGSELTLAMADGTSVTVKNHWWSSVFPGTVSPAVGDVESLRKCYVFSGGLCIDPADLAALRATYDGPVYEYWDYEKHLKAATPQPQGDGFTAADMMDARAEERSRLSTPQARPDGGDLGEGMADARRQFTEWLAREMPPGTVVSDPRWWAPKIIRAFHDYRTLARATATAPAPDVARLVERLSSALVMHDQRRTTLQSLASSVGDFLRDYRAQQKEGES